MVVNDILIPLSYILLRIGYNCDDLIRFSSFDTSFLGTKNEFVENNVFTCHTSIRPDYVGNIELSIFQTSTCSSASFNLFE
jgi:hypothetical protein